jgi:hypothetical protein
MLKVQSFLESDITQESLPEALVKGEFKHYYNWYYVQATTRELLIAFSI